MTKITGLVQGFLKSIPQIIIQVYNGGTLNDWNFVLIISISTSVFSLVFTCFMALYMYDRITEKHVTPENIDSVVSFSFSFEKKEPHTAWEEEKRMENSNISLDKSYRKSKTVM